MGGPGQYPSALQGDEAATSLLSDSPETWRQESYSHPSRRPRNWILVGISLVAIFVTNLLTYLLTHHITIQTHRSLAEPPNGRSNIFRDLELLPRPKLLNTTFYNKDHSVYREHASIAADEAWEYLAPMDKGVFLVQKEDALQSGIDPERHAYFDAQEEGIVGYPVAVEAMHQVHCLNLLRKNLYFNYDFTVAQAQKKCPEENTPHCGMPHKYYELHIDHCVDFLRNRLMCTTDLGIVPLLWLEDNGKTTGDMGRMHMCRDYEAARRFFDKGSIGLPKAGSIESLKPKEGDYVVWDYI